MPKCHAIAGWRAFTLALIAFALPAAAAEHADRGPMGPSGQPQAAAEQSSTPDASLAPTPESRLFAAREAVDAAMAEVAKREAAKRAADGAAHRAIAAAAQKLAIDGGAAAAVSEDEAAKLRAGVVRAIGASDEAGRALADARSALSAVEKVAAEEVERAVKTVKAAKVEAQREVATLTEEAGRLAKAVDQAVADVAKAEAARYAAELEVKRLNRIALEAIANAADARRALASARESEAAVEEELAKLAAEAKQMALNADGRP